MRPRRCRARAFGNSSIASEQAPSYFGFDATIGKRFKFGERRSLDFRTEFFNVLNHASFGPSRTQPGNAGHLRPTQTTSPRNIQFGLKRYF